MSHNETATQRNDHWLSGPEFSRLACAGLIPGLLEDDARRLYDAGFEAGQSDGLGQSEAERDEGFEAGREEGQEEAGAMIDETLDQIENGLNGDEDAQTVRTVIDQLRDHARDLKEA